MGEGIPPSVAASPSPARGDGIPPSPQLVPVSGEGAEGLNRTERGLRRLLLDIALFSRHAISTPLRPYQLEPALAILDSVLHGRGRTFVVMMSRQAGKNELSAQLEAYLLNRFQRRGGAVVKAAPTFEPQIANSILRLERALENDLTRGRWARHLGAIQLGRARVLFFSGEPESHVVGATASLLLEIDEAQDFDEEKYLKDFRPMGASTNVTTVLYGTAWTGDTLLEHVRADNARLEALDGVRRNFVYAWPAIAEHNPAYRAFVEAEIARMGEEHPLVRTQYLLEAISSAGRLLSETQLSQLSAPVRPEVLEGRTVSGPGGASSASARTETYVAGIDLAGEDEEAEDAVLRAAEPRRDSTAVAIARVEWRTELGVPEPHVEVVHFYWWTGRKHRELLPQLIDLLRNTWHVESVTVDATGVGAGIASFLVGALGADRVHPFTFSAVSKSDLGYQLLAAINSGRLRVPAYPAVAGQGRGRKPVPLLPRRERLGEGPAGQAAKRGTGLAVPPDASALGDEERAGQAVASGQVAPYVGARHASPLHDEGEAAVVEFWKQARLARSTLHANQRLSWYVDPREGHDDLLISVALTVEAAQHSRPRVAAGRVARRVE